MSTRVTDFAQTALTQYQMQQVQTQITNLQTQISSGHVAQTYDGLAGSAQQLINLQNESTKVNQYVSSIGLADQRIQTAQSSIGSLISLATQFQTLLVNALNAQNAPNLSLNQQALSQMQQAAGLMNVQFDGQYLFSGTATGTVPVNLNAPSFTAPPSTYPSTADTSYYQGNGGALTVQADDNLSVNYGVTAASPGFEELIRAMHLAATAVVIPGSVDTARLNEALRVTKLAINDITDVQSNLGVAQNVIDSAKTAHSQLLTLLQGSISDIQNVDVAKASTDLSSAQLTLESSYAVTARLSQLSLVKFL